MRHAVWWMTVRMILAFVAVCVFEYSDQSQRWMCVGVGAALLCAVICPRPVAPQSEEWMVLCVVWTLADTVPFSKLINVIMVQDTSQHPLVRVLVGVSLFVFSYKSGSAMKELWRQWWWGEARKC